MFKSVDIFEARKEGYKTYRVPGITVSKNNVVLATAESRPISGGDWDFNDVIMSYHLVEQLNLYRMGEVFQLQHFL